MSTPVTKLEMSSSCKVPVRLNPKALPYTFVPSNKINQHKRVTSLSLRISPRIPLVPPTDDGFSSFNGSPQDLVMVSSTANSLMSYDMLNAFAVPGSLINDLFPPLFVEGFDLPVAVTSQATLRDSSLKVWVLPKGYSLDHLILSECDLNAESWHRNHINDFPFLTHPSRSPVRLYRINKVLFANFYTLFSVHAKSNVFRLPFILPVKPNLVTPAVLPVSPVPPPTQLVHYTIYGNVRESNLAKICDFWHRSCGHMSLPQVLAIHKGGYIKNFCNNLTAKQIKDNWTQRCGCCDNGVFNVLRNPYTNLPESPKPTITSKPKTADYLPILDSPPLDIEGEKYFILETGITTPDSKDSNDTIVGDVMVFYGPTVKLPPGQKYRQMVIYTTSGGFKVGFAMETSAQIPHTLACMFKLMTARKITVKELRCHFSTDRLQADHAWNTYACQEQAGLYGFRMTFSSPDNHAQNGEAEASMLWARRALRKVISDKDPELIKDCWTMAAFDCILKDNYFLPDRRDPNISRYEGFFGVRPDLGVHPVARWGAKVRYAVTQNGSAKLPPMAPRSEVGFIMQCLPDCKGAFRILDPKLGSMFISRSIRFDFPPLGVEYMDPALAATADSIIPGSPLPIFLTDDAIGVNPQLINTSLIGTEFFRGPHGDSLPLSSPDLLLPPVPLVSAPVTSPVSEVVGPPPVPYVRESDSSWYRKSEETRQSPINPDPDAPFAPVVSRKRIRLLKKPIVPLHQTAISPSRSPDVPSAVVIPAGVDIIAPQLDIPEIQMGHIPSPIPATWPRPYKKGVFVSPKLAKTGVDKKQKKIPHLKKDVILPPLVAIPKPFASPPPSSVPTVEDDSTSTKKAQQSAGVRKSSRSRKAKVYFLKVTTHAITRSISSSPSSYSYTNMGDVLVHSPSTATSTPESIRPSIPVKMDNVSDAPMPVHLNLPLQTQVFCYLTSLTSSIYAPRPGVYSGPKTVRDTTEPILTPRMISDVHKMEAPASLTKAKAFANWPDWAKSVAVEMNNFHSNNKGPALSKDQLPPGATIIHSKLIFDIKLLPDGLLDKLKCRLVALGNLQKDGSYDDVYAPTAMSKTSFLFLNIINAKNMHHGSVDISAAFLTAKLDRVMYLKLPKEYTDGKDVYYLLTQSLYGLRQAAHLFNKELHGLLISKGYAQSKNDPCLYTYLAPNGDMLHVCAHVDDLLYGSTSLHLCEKFVTDIRSKYTATHTPDTTAHCGILITRDKTKQTLLLSMPGTINGALARFNLSDCKIRSSPGISTPRTAPSKGLGDKGLYAEMVGTIRYIADRTHPEILYPAFELATHSQAPTLENMADARNVFRYLKGVKDHGILFAGDSLILEVYCDASFNSGPKGLSHWATSYHLGSMSGCFHAESKRMKFLSLSSTDAEYVGLYNACKETVYQRSLLEDFHIPQSDPTVIFQDNAQTITWGNKKPKHQAGKHLDLKYNYSGECIERNFVTLTKLHTDEMRPDLNTKNTAVSVFTHLMPRMTRPSTVIN